MDLTTKTSSKSSPIPKTPRSKPSNSIPKSSKDENQNPNLITHNSKLPKSPLIKKTPKSVTKNPILVFSGKNRIRDRKFVVAKRNVNRDDKILSKKECSCIEKVGNKCLCLAYESLRASQEEFFKKKTREDIKTDVSEGNESYPDRDFGFREVGCDRNVSGRGKVMSLVKAFEKLKTECKNEWESDETCLNLSSGFLVSSSLDSSRGSFTFSSKGGGSCVGRRSRRNSTELSGIFGGRRWRKKQQLRATRQQPFRLLTEQRGRTKEEEFSKKLQEMAAEEQKQRIPIAQGLPWTTDEPENLVKPPVKEITIPVDLVLHSDVRAVERGDFDQQLAEKEALIEQWKMERERQQKIAEEEEIRRLRKELIPKAQPMPYFDRPFIPRRSEKDPTIPIEPKFHLPPHQKKIKSCLSWNSFSSYQQ